MHPTPSVTLRRSRRAFLTLLLGGTAACAGESATTEAIVVRDSSGVTIVENALDKLNATCSIAATPSLSIGEEDGEEAYLLTRSNGVRRLADGRIVVVMQAVKEVRWFGADGRFIRASGRDGSGPGEFTNPYTVFRLPGDTIYVGNSRPFFFNVFDSDGNYVRRVTPEPVMGNPARSFAILDDGRLMLGVNDEDGVRGPGMNAERRRIQLHDRDGVVSDTLRTMENGRIGSIIEGSNFFVMPMFESYSHSAALDSIVVLGHGAERELQVWTGNPTMRLSRVIRWTGGSRAVTKADVDAERAFETARYEKYNAQLRGMMKDRHESSVHPNRPVADVMPAMNGIRLGTDGRIWIREFQVQSDSSPRRWVAFNRDGRFDCRLSTPKFVEFHEYGADYLLVMEQDTLEVERVRLYPLKKNAAP